MKGKELCEFLKGIRKRMADANGIAYSPHECHYEGDCSGTCPACEKEAAELMDELRKKEAVGADLKETDTLILENEKTLMGDVSAPGFVMSEEEMRAFDALKEEIERSSKKERLWQKMLTQMKRSCTRGIIEEE